MKLLDIDNLSSSDIHAIWSLVRAKPTPISGTVACSFEGNGIRTRTTYIQSFNELELTYIELPNLLKTKERVCDLAGYLDPFYSAYVVRYSDHERLRKFALASSRPVINAMTSLAHPCEVLSDGYYIDSEIKPIHEVKVGLWGPTTNVFRSWYALAATLGIEIQHFCGPDYHSVHPNVIYSSCLNKAVDILVTDGWPSNFSDSNWSLDLEHLASLGNPKLLPTPPFSIGKEVSFDPLTYSGFLGYEQKSILLSVQRAILAYLMN